MPPSENSGPRSVSAQTALIQHLDRDYPKAIQQRGKQLIRSRLVGELWQDGDVVAARVQGSEPDPYTATIQWVEGAWYAECECPYGTDCKHSYAVGLAWLAIGEPLAKVRKQKTVRSPTFAQQWAPKLAKNLGRPLQPAERQALGNLGQLFDVLKKYGRLTRREVFDAQLMPPGEKPGAMIWEDAFPGWWDEASVPNTAWELWNYIAYNWTRQGEELPEAFRSQTDLTRVRQRLDERMLRAEIGTWHRALGASDISGTDASPEHSILLEAPCLEAQLTQTGNLLLRHRPGPEQNWRRPTKAWLAELATASLSVIESLPMPGRALALALRLGLGGYPGITLERDGALSRDQTKRVLASESARAAVALPSGEPFRIEAEPLELHARPSADDPARLDVQLLTPAGKALPEGTKPFLNTPKPLYLVDNKVWQGPPALPARRLPVAALSDPALSTKLKEIGLRLPAQLKAQFETVVLKPHVTAWLNAAQPGTWQTTEYFCWRLMAIATDPACAQIWRGHGGWDWVAEARPAAPTADSPHYAFDLRPAQAVAGTIAPLQMYYADDIDAWNCAVSADFPERFTEWHASLPPGVTVEVSPELAGLIDGGLRAKLSANLTPAESSGQDWFDLTLELDTADLTLTDEELTLLRKAQGRWVRLPRLGWQKLDIAVPDDASQAALAQLGLDAKQELADMASSRQQQRFHALQLANFPVADEVLAKKLRDRVQHLKNLPPPDIPANIDATLRPYQKEGFHFLAHLATQGLGGILADDMGLGKTLQALCWLAWLQSQHETPIRVLVVCPKSVVSNWENEAARFYRDLPTARLAKGVRELPKAGLLVINYTQLRLKEPLLSTVSWDAVILDEGQNIKNPASATAQAARGLKARHRIVLSGTPIENRLLDLWSLLAFAQPGLLGGQTSFKRSYREKEDPTGAYQRLAQRVRPFLLRRTKGEVARDLPERTEEDIFCELEGTQLSLYQAELKRAQQILLKVENARQFDAARFNILQSLLRLRQICCDPRLLLSKDDHDAKTASSAKLSALLETLETILESGNRVLIFSQFVGMLELIREALQSRKIDHLLLTGQTEDRQELVDRFQADDGPPVFLLSLKAAGSGLNLTAASYVILYDPWWNPAVEAQAIDRTHRIGQESHVIAYRMIAKDTIEEKIRALQQNKAAMAAAVVQEESLAKVMDLDSLREILS